MYSKDELLAKDYAQLVDIAKELGAELMPEENVEQLVYSILDQQAIDGSKNTTGTKRKRTRISKKDTDKVYTVNGAEGENLDLKKAKEAEESSTPKAKTSRSKKTAAEEPKAQETPEEIPQPVAEEQSAAPKRRGRKTKAEKAAEAEAAKTENKPDNTVVSENETTLMADSSVSEEVTTNEMTDTPQAEQPEDTSSNVDNRPQSNDSFFFDSEERLEEGEELSEEMIAKLQAKAIQHNEQQEQDFDEEMPPVWEGDPGNGIDFIPIVDLPIEDQSALPTYDMLDNPTMPIQDSVQAPPSIPAASQRANVHARYDFSDIVKANGVLEVMPDGYGFLRSSDYNYLSSPDDVYINVNQVKRYGLKTGDVVECRVRPPHDGEKYFPLTSIDSINGRKPSEVRDRIPFEHLTPLFPDEKFTLCGDRATSNLSVRIVDLFSPIGKGQRALIVAQPKTGKTILMKDIANAIAANHPEAYLMMLLIDERPEEVTDMARTVNAEVIASTFDEPAERHVKIAGIVLEKAKRMVECGHDVVIFLDSITRLARAYNTVAPASGKVLTGGVDANALQKPKRFFGAARNIEGGGSLTIVATALIDTGSKMDEVIFEEFKGTGNMELQLDRTLSNKRIFPAVNLVASSTRRDDLLQDKTTLDRMWILRKAIADMTPIEAMNEIHGRMAKTHNNEEFLLSMNS